jgi:hypothetical protein
VVVAFYAVGTGVAFLGLVEYVFPGIKNALPGFVSNPEGYESTGGFIRARFSFYGGSIAVFLCMLSLPFGFAAWQWWPRVLPRLGASAAALTQLAGLYVSGYRSMWLLAGLLLVVFALASRRFILAGVLVAAGVAAVGFLPEETRERLASVEKILEGHAEDASGVKRQERIQGALHSSLSNPFGGGWASAGWVHSDFLQISASLGLAAGLLLLFGYFATLARLAMRQASASASRELTALGIPMLLSFVVVGQMLAIQGVEFLSFTSMPLWLVWALAHIWPSQTISPPDRQARDRRLGRSNHRGDVFPSRLRPYNLAPGRRPGKDLIAHGQLESQTSG